MRNSDDASPIPVVVIDDHAVVHAGIQQWLADDGVDIQIVGTYLSAQHFLTDHDHRAAPRAVVVYDPEMGERRPNYPALERLRTMRHPVIIYSRIVSPEVILTCLDHGAVSYVAKSEPAQHLLEAVTTAWTGTRYLSPSMAAAMHTAQERGRPGLTAQERRVLIAWLHTDNKEAVAQRLHIAPSTVKTHLQRVRHRYATAGRPARAKVTLFARAVQDGLVSVHEL
jgi:DNA-binding NarL/FixJ family response regulator